MTNFTRAEDAEARTAYRAAEHERQLDRAYEYIQGNRRVRVGQLAAELGVARPQAGAIVSELSGAGCVRQFGAVAIYVPVPR